MTKKLKRAAQTVTSAIADWAIARTPELTTATISTPVSRVDGHLKVTGAARYASDVRLPEMTHAEAVPSTIARGRISRIEADEIAALPGVLAVITHQNAPRLKRNLVPQIAAGHWSLGGDFRPLQDDRVRFAGQPVAVIVAETLEQARDAASRLRVTYEASPAETELRQALDDAFPPKPLPVRPDYTRGDAVTALAAAPVRIEQEYATPPQTNNPLGLFATVASWEGDGPLSPVGGDSPLQRRGAWGGARWEGAKLTLYDANQATRNVMRSAASVLGLSGANVHVISPIVGGAFGAGLRAWPHAWLAAMAARVVGRPVKLVLPRNQMFTAVGRRAQTVQRVALGAERDGALTAIIHHATHDTSRHETFTEALGMATRSLYACPNVATHYRLTRLDRATPNYMRCPGESETLFALESALDELAIALAMDPIALRQRNEPDVDPANGHPWSSRSVSACYARGAELFDWSRRTPAPGSMREGDVLIGLGTATATYPAVVIPAAALACLYADGTALVRSAATDIGPGTATALTQVAADTLGLPLERVRVEIGDSTYPMAPPQGGSILMASVGSAVFRVCSELRKQAIALAIGDAHSPLAGADADVVQARDGLLMRKDDPTRAESYQAILARAGRDSLQVEAKSMPLAQRLGHSCHAFGAQFAEVHVDVALRTIRVPRLLGVFGVGRVINPKLARGQLMGGMIWGMSQALLEETVYDHRLNRIVNASLADYLLPVNADVHRIEVEFIAEDDPYVNPLGVKGVGEIGMAGVAPAIANAVYHATGIRVRELPVTIEKLLPEG